MLILFYIERGHHSINLDDENDEHRDILHKIVKSEAYSDEEFTEAATMLGKNWYWLKFVVLTHCSDNTCSFEYTDKDGRTPIMIAAKLNKYRKLSILLNVYTSQLKMTSLHVMLSSSSL